MEQEGVRVATKPEGLELWGCRKGKWDFVVNKLKKLKSTECVILDIPALTKQQAQAMRFSIQHSAKRMGHKGKIKFANQEGKLYVW